MTKEGPGVVFSYCDVWDQHAKVEWGFNCLCIYLRVGLTITIVMTAGSCWASSIFMMTSSNGKHFPRYCPFVRGIHRSPVNSPHKGQWRGALMFSLIYAWLNGEVNNREAGDLRRHRAHYDVTVMFRVLWSFYYTRQLSGKVLFFSIMFSSQITLLLSIWYCYIPQT